MTKIYSSASKTKPSKTINSVQTPIAGRESEMVNNLGGNFTFQVSDLDRLDRFLILGSDKNQYYGSAKKMTEMNTKDITGVIERLGPKAVARIVEISDQGRAPKNDPALYALALAMTHGSDETKAAAYEAIPKVARIGTHILHLADYVHGMRGWGRGVRRGFSSWYNGRSALSLAKQITKYAQRDGWSHMDVLRLAHISPKSDDHDAIFSHIVGKAKEVNISDEVSAYMSAVDEMKSVKNAKDAIRLIEQYQIPRELIPTELLNDKNVWAALLPNMGPEAMIRNLGKMTSIGLLDPMSDAQKTVTSVLTDSEKLLSARIHPVNVLSAQRVYASGHGVKGNLTWNPNQKIVSALEDAFYGSFKAVDPSGKRRGIFLDISGSMGMYGSVIEGLTCRDVTAVMAMVTVRTEEDVLIKGFSHKLVDIKINDKMSLNEAVNVISNLPFGSTNPGLAIDWATKNRVVLDSYEIYTDNEVNTGSHPVQLLRIYRKAVNPQAKLMVAATMATDFTIADPNDAGCLDICAFDSAGPQILANFIRG